VAELVRGLPATTKSSTRLLRELPKAHLHLHFEGAMRPNTLDSLSEHYGVTAPRLGGPLGSFATFQALYLAARDVLRSLDDLGRLVHEVVEDAASDGAVWVEIAVHPADHARIAAPEVVLDALLAAGRESALSTGTGVGWLLTADRTLPPRRAMEVAQLAASFAVDGVVGLGLANDETRAPAELFTEAFAEAAQAGLLCAPHAGEHAGPESVVGALDALGAHRIQHGVRAAEDLQVVARLAEQAICLDVCPTSNVALSVVSDLASHPLPDLVAAGVPCSINADDPLLFGVGLLDEYELCRTQLGLDDLTLAACARASIVHSGAPGSLKVKALVGIDAWLDASNDPDGMAAR